MKGNYPHWGSALSTSVTELLLLPKFNNNSPSVTQDTEIFHVIMSYHYYHLMRSTHGTLSMMFTCCPNLMFLASPWLEICRFSNYSYCYFEQFKADINLITSGKSELTLFVPFYWLWIGNSYFTSLGMSCCEKQSKSSVVDQSQESRIESGLNYFQLFNQWKSRTGFLSQ